VKLFDRFGGYDAPVSRRHHTRNRRDHAAFFAAQRTSGTVQAVLQAHPFQIESAFGPGMNSERRRELRRLAVGSEGRIREEIANALLEGIAAEGLDKSQCVGAGLHLDSLCTMAAKRY